MDGEILSRLFEEEKMKKTAVAFVSAVRFWPDGEVWKADIDEVFRTAVNMSGLSFLSETIMLEIEKK